MIINRVSLSHTYKPPRTLTRRTSKSQTQSISLELNCLTFSATGTEFIVKERALMDDLSSAQAWQASRRLLPRVFFENGPSTYSKDQLGLFTPTDTPNFSSLILVYGLHKSRAERSVVELGEENKRIKNTRLCLSALNRLPPGRSHGSFDAIDAACLFVL